MRNSGILIITIDDPEDKRLETDMAFYPPVPQIKRMDWTGFSGKLFVGWEWMILRKEFSFAPNPKLQAPCSLPHMPKILVTMGASDPQGMTIKVIKALKRIEEDFEVTIVLGAGFQNRKEIDSLLSNCKHSFDILVNVQDMVKLMSESDFAIASFGVTAYELAAMGVPAIYLCLTEDHAESASAFVEAGMAVCLGIERIVSEDEIVNAIKKTLKELKKSDLMRKRQAQVVDGQGIVRISNLITKRFEDKNGKN